MFFHVVQIEKGIAYASAYRLLIEVGGTWEYVTWYTTNNSSVLSWDSGEEVEVAWITFHLLCQGTPGLTNTFAEGIPRIYPFAPKQQLSRDFRWRMAKPCALCWRLSSPCRGGKKRCAARRVGNWLRSSRALLDGSTVQPSKKLIKIKENRIQCHSSLGYFPNQQCLTLGCAEILTGDVSWDAWLWMTLRWCTSRVLWRWGFGFQR